jgi:hypothetical protein
MTTASFSASSGGGLRQFGFACIVEHLLGQVLAYADRFGLVFGCLRECCCRRAHIELTAYQVGNKTGSEFAEECNFIPNPRGCDRERPHPLSYLIDNSSLFDATGSSTSRAISLTASRGVQCSPASSLFFSLKRRTSSSKSVPIP